MISAGSIGGGGGRNLIFGFGVVGLGVGLGTFGVTGEGGMGKLGIVPWGT